MCDNIHIHLARRDVVLRAVALVRGAEVIDHHVRGLHGRAHTNTHTQYSERRVMKEGVKGESVQLKMCA